MLVDWMNLRWSKYFINLLMDEWMDVIRTDNAKEYSYTLNRFPSCVFVFILVMCLQFSLTLLAADTGNANESAFLFHLSEWVIGLLFYLFIDINCYGSSAFVIYIFMEVTYSLYITVLQCVIFHFCIYRFHCVVVTPVSIPVCFSFEMLINVFWNIVLERIHSFLS